MGWALGLSGVLGSPLLAGSQAGVTRVTSRFSPALCGNTAHLLSHDRLGAAVPGLKVSGPRLVSLQGTTHPWAAA